MSGRTVAVLGQLRAAGVPFVVVTGRPVRWAEVVLDEIGRYAEVICANGALILDADGAELASWPLESALLSDLIPRIKTAIPAATVAVERREGFAKEIDFPTKSDLSAPGIERWPDLAARPALKLLVRLAGASGDVLLAEVEAAIGARAVATNSTASGLVEISAPGVTKAAALTWLAHRHRLGAEAVMAFGDMPNDISMLRWAGHSVVVAGAHPAAKAVADEVAGSNDEDGVAAVLERMLVTAS